MSISRIYQASPFIVSTSIALDGKASHHLAKVLRASVGDQLTLFNGQGDEYAATITEITKKQVQVEITACVVRDVESPLKITLAQGIARGEKMDFIVQKAVELGVSKIVPLVTERCNVHLDKEREAKRLQHWQAVIVSACEQSGRNKLPEITAPMRLNDWVEQVSADRCFVLTPHLTTQLPETALPADATIVLLIGPEGGLSDAEVNAALQKQFLALHLGPRILRTETATLAAITAMQCKFGDF